MTTTDAEAIARAKGHADRIRWLLSSYLASRREAQEPVAWRWRFIDSDYWTVCKTRPKQVDDRDVWCEPLYTVPQAPAGEVERLREALRAAEAEIADLKSRCAAEGVPTKDINLSEAAGKPVDMLTTAIGGQSRAALNGGRADE